MLIDWTSDLWIWWYQNTLLNSNMVIYPFPWQSEEIINHSDLKYLKCMYSQIFLTISCYYGDLPMLCYCVLTLASTRTQHWLRALIGSRSADLFRSGCRTHGLNVSGFLLKQLMQWDPPFFLSTSLHSSQSMFGDIPESMDTFACVLYCINISETLTYQ